ncbi:phage major capsid protein [Virgisporangium aliadipatigenens]|uniref:phage major capsid protein n=1 Tax=Virgisporangium aliadipatigenens TaxID=741659 RepID=UPI0019441BCA|nr:phage major capsid protein [Virgisporangium aliadipatigenens]
MSATLLARAVERQQKIWARMQEISGRADAEGRDLSAEERSNWDAAEAELNEAGADVERFQRSQARNEPDRRGLVDTGSGGDDVQDDEAGAAYQRAFGNYLRRGMGRLSPEERELMEARFVENRDQSTQADAAGGYLVPDGFRNKMVETIKAYGGIASVVETITTDSGNDLPWVGNDDTGNEGEIIGENTAVGNQDFVFTGRKLKAHIFSSKMVKVPLTLLQDSVFDLESWIPGKLGERIGRRAARAWITGTGVDEPQGIVTGAVTGKTGANGQTTTVIYDDLVDLEHSIDPGYRGRARFALHDSTLAVVRKLKDGEGRPLWVPTPTTGFVNTINGYPYTIDNSMPTPAASAKTIGFGDFRSHYVIRQVKGVSTMRLAERYAEYLQVAFFGWARMDGMIQDPAAVKFYSHSAS